MSGVNNYLNSNRNKYLAQTLRPIVYLLENLYRIANLVVPPTDGNTKCLLHCKVHPVVYGLTDAGNRVQIDPQLATLTVQDIF